jgi:hypothetical protein
MLAGERSSDKGDSAMAEIVDHPPLDWRFRPDYRLSLCDLRLVYQELLFPND